MTRDIRRNLFTHPLGVIGRLCSVIVALQGHLHHWLVELSKTFLFIIIFLYFVAQKTKPFEAGLLNKGNQTSIKVMYNKTIRSAAMWNSWWDCIILQM